MQKRNSISLFLHPDFRVLFSVFCALIFLFSSSLYLFIPRPSLADETVTVNVTVSATVAGEEETPFSGVTSMYGSVQTSVRFTGEAYPHAIVTVLKNGTIVNNTRADSTGLFSITLKEKYDSTILYSLYARDIAGNKSLLINYPLVVTAGYVTHLSGIRFPPTITLDKVQARAGDYLTVGGYAMGERELQVTISGQNGEPIEEYTLTSARNGRYSITLPLLQIQKGNYSVHIKYKGYAHVSKLVKLIISTTNIPNTDISLNIPGDCNADGIINLVDFSVLAFWYKKSGPPYCIDLNHDRIINLTDFSILAFYWTN